MCLWLTFDDYPVPMAFFLDKATACTLYCKIKYAALFQHIFYILGQKLVQCEAGKMQKNCKLTFWPL